MPGMEAMPSKMARAYVEVLAAVIPQSPFRVTAKRTYFLIGFVTPLSTCLRADEEAVTGRPSLKGEGT